MTVTVTVYESWAAIERLTGAWRALQARSASSEPTTSPLWLRAWWQTFGDTGRELAVMALRDRGELIGLAPMQRLRAWHRRSIPLRRVALLASGEPERDEICSDYIGLIGERGREGEVARAFVDALVHGTLGAWDELRLPSMAADAPMTLAVLEALDAAQLRVEVEEQPACPFIPLPRSWEAYLRALSSAHRRVVRKAERDLAAWAGGDVHYREARNRAELEAAFDILVSLHEQRWRADNQRGVFASPRFRRFHRQVMPALLAEGALELSWLEARGRPVAAIYNLVWDGRVHFYQSGRAINLPRQLRPGIAIHAHAIRSAIERGRREYDFLSGESRYKRQLALDARPLITVRAARPTAAEVARTAVEWGRGRLKVLRERLAGSED